MRIALYDPISVHTASYQRTRPSLALLGIAHEAQKAKAEVLVVEESRTTHRRALDAIRSFHPDVIGISTYFDPACMLLVKDVIREFNRIAKIALGGHDVSSRPKEAAALYQPNFMFLNEGEMAFAHMVAAGFNLTRVDPQLVEIREINGVPVIISKIPYPLDSYPLPTEFPPTFPEDKRYDEAAINIARGCIGGCTFCGGAKKPLSYMTPARVLEHIRAWLSLENNNIDLMAPDFTSRAPLASEIIRELNRHPEAGGLKYFFSVRLDSLDRALDLAPEEWTAFFRQNEVTIEAGYETGIARRLSREHLGKSEDAEKHLASLIRLLQTGVKVAVDLISFDPDSTFAETAQDYTVLLGLARKYTNMTIYPEALFRELKIFPGTRAAQIFGTKDYRSRPFKDRKLRLLLDTLIGHRDFFGISPHRSLTSSLERIVAIIYFLQKRGDRATVNMIDSFIAHLEENPGQVSSHLPQ